MVKPVTKAELRKMIEEEIKRQIEEMREVLTMDIAYMTKEENSPADWPEPGQIDMCPVRG